MRYSLRELWLVITCFCVCLGSYWAGWSNGQNAGYVEASDHTRVMLYLHAQSDTNWKNLQQLASCPQSVDIIGTRPCPDSRSHQSFMSLLRK